MTFDLFESTWQDLWTGHDQQEPVGSVFTKPEIVDLILDLSGYSPARSRLAQRRVLEPSCGDGAFVTRVVARLIESERRVTGRLDWKNPLLDEALCAADISARSLEMTRSSIAAQLTAEGCPSKRAVALAEKWAIQTDFLLHDWAGRYDLVVGNPPYVRIERLPKRVLARYRTLYATAGDRADLYIAFFERGLSLLSQRGALAFITANRFAKNLYGRSLRKLIADQYHVRYYLNLEHTQPFQTEVSAYPAIVVVDRRCGNPTLAASLDDVEPQTLVAVRSQTVRRGNSKGILSRFASWYPDGGPWLTTRSEEHAAFNRLNDSLPVLEDSAPGTHVGIGVATGADRVFVLPEMSKSIEAALQIPLLMAGDISHRGLSWSGCYLVNPFDSADDGSLVDLSEFPGFAAYVEQHATELRRRHVARSRPHAWFRTIDRIWPKLQHVRKLVIPDIQSREATTVGLDDGRFYPHHNVYWVASDSWDLRALMALLRSSIVRSQVRAYSVQMRGGSLRWQAQTLRKLRVPHLAALTDSLLEHLAGVSASDSQEEIDGVAADAFALRRTSALTPVSVRASRRS